MPSLRRLGPKRRGGQVWVGFFKAPLFLAAGDGVGGWVGVTDNFQPQLLILWAPFETKPR